MEQQGQDEDSGTPEGSRKRRATPSEPTTEAKAAREDESSDVSSRRQREVGASASASTSSAQVDDTGDEEEMSQGVEREPKEKPSTSVPTNLPLDTESPQTSTTSTSKEPSATGTATPAPAIAADVPSTSFGVYRGHPSRFAAMTECRQPSTDSTDSSSMAMAFESDDEADTAVLPQEGSIPAHAIELGGLTIGLQNPAETTTGPQRPSFLRLPSAACASTSGATSQPSGSAGPSRSQSQPSSVSSGNLELYKLSKFLHEKQPNIFPTPTAAFFSIEQLRSPKDTPSAGSTEDPGAEVDLNAICTHTDQNDCWLLQCQQVLNRVLVPYGLEIAQLHMRTYTLRHVGEDPTQAELPEDMDGLNTPETQSQVRRTDLVTWLLRYHRCIASLRLNLSAVTPLPMEFCDGWQLHRGYVAIELGVKSSRTGVPERLREADEDGGFEEGPLGLRLFQFLEIVSLLTELSLFGLYFSRESDEQGLPSLVSANRRLRKLSFQQCHIVNRNVAALLEAVMNLPSLEEFSLSLRNTGHPEMASARLEQLIRRPSQLRKLCLEVDASFVHLFESLAVNTSVTDLHIKTLVNLGIFGALHRSCMANNTLRRLTLNVDFSSKETFDVGRDMLVQFLSETGLECLTFETPAMTVDAAEAIAVGLEMNGSYKEFREGKTFLEKLYIKCSHVHFKYEALKRLVQALDLNKKLDFIDVGLVHHKLEDKPFEVTNDILNFTKARIASDSPGDTTSGKVLFPLVKAYFAEDLPFLIAALERGMYFHKFTNVFLRFPGREPSHGQIEDFHRLLALFSRYDTRDEIQSLTINVPFMDTPHGLALSTLCSLSPSLTELSVNYGDACSPLSSILLFEGVARSTSIRKLTASGFCLEQPVPKWFEYMCRESTTLQDLHIHVCRLSDEANAEFLRLLPMALRECLTPILRFRLTHGGEKQYVILPEGLHIIEIDQILPVLVGNEIDVYLPEVLDIIRMNQMLFAQALRLVLDLERFRSENLNQNPHQNPQDLPLCPDALTTQRAKAFGSARHMPGFLDYVRDSTAWSTEKVASELKLTRDLIARYFLYLTNVCQILQNAPGTPDHLHTMAGLPLEVRVFLFRMLKIQNVRQQRNERPADVTHQENIHGLGNTVTAIFVRERSLELEHSGLHNPDCELSPKGTAN
ncbi:uncharacterized protein LOC144142430 isoform X2 [Haemaphysalis longicornis]